MEIEKFRDATIQKALYSARNPDSLPSDILTPGNSTVNARMAHLVITLANQYQTLEGAYAFIVDTIPGEVIEMNRTVDGFSIIKAIEAEGCKASVAVEEKKKLGII
jgi:hypothetical protein